MQKLRILGQKNRQYAKIEGNLRESARVPVKQGAKGRIRDKPEEECRSKGEFRENQREQTRNTKKAREVEKNREKQGGIRQDERAIRVRQYRNER